MKVSRVSKMSPEARFLYWIRERHAIYLRRKEGKPKPWTDDEILQSYFFTNPYRENDKTTVWFRENVRDRMKHSDSVLFATVCFRWFNYIPTGETLKRNSLFTKWGIGRTVRLLEYRDKVFTGAYMIPGIQGMTKVQYVCGALQKVWDKRLEIAESIRSSKSMKRATSTISSIDGLGGFMAYEVACDLRYTDLLKDATDKLTWCNPGPGAKRGLNRLLSRPIAATPKDWQERTVELLHVVRNSLSDMPRFEMREVEHSLCEFDKYERVRLSEGRSKRRFNGA